MSRLIAALLLFQINVLADEVIQDFEKLDLGYPPDELFIIDGNFEVVEHDKGRALKLLPDPLIECGLLFGKSSKGPMTVEGRAFSTKRGRRSFPRFAMGVHGISGYRLRVVPAQKRIELVHNEAVVKTADFLWESGKWCSMKLAVSENDGTPIVKAWVWMSGQKASNEPTLEFEGEKGTSSQGKASLWGTPYSGKPILYDDLKVTWEPSRK